MILCEQDGPDMSMSPGFPMLYVMGFAFAISLAFSGFMIHVGIGDVPEGRSNHTRTTPTAGGVGIVAGLGGLFLILPQFFTSSWALPEWPMILSVLWAVGLLGLMDDAFGIPTGLQFMLFIFLGALAFRIIVPVAGLPYAASHVGLPYWAGFAGSLLWIFAVTNVVNFMDGSNGLMAVVMGTAFLALAAIATFMGAFHAVLIPAAMAAGLIGFLPYNFRNKALIFSGDTGALVTGFGFAIAVLWLCRERTLDMPVFIGPVLLLPFLTDSLLTLLRRAMNKENLFEPHKKHVYQRLIAAGYSHVAVALCYGAATLAVAIYAFYAVKYGFHRYTAFLLFPVMLFSVIYYALVSWLKKKAVS